MVDFSSLVPFWLWLRWRTWLRRDKSVRYYLQRVILVLLLAAFIAIEVAWYRAGEPWAWLIVGGIALLVASYYLAIAFLSVAVAVIALLGKVKRWRRS
jgi:hypothetical protein